MQLNRAVWQTLGWQTSFAGDSITIRHFTEDSRKVRRDWAFFAIDGTRVKGKDFVWEAIEKGARAVFADAIYRQEISADPRFNNRCPVFFADRFRESLGKLVSFLNGDPSRELQVVGVTGTNGKTTVALVFHELVRAMGRKSAYAGTLGLKIRDNHWPSGNTTPLLTEIHSFLRRAVRHKVTLAALEASSHGLHQGRLDGIFWNVGIFTNLTQDHLDYHGNMQSYFEAKRILFEQIVRLDRAFPGSVNGVIINLGDKYARMMSAFLTQHKPGFPVVTLGEGGSATLAGIQPSWSGYRATIVFAQKSYSLKSQFLGLHNLMNLSSVFLASLLLGFAAEETLRILATIKPPEGRMQVFDGPGNRHIIVDYAHTPDALEKVLKTLQELNPVRIVLVFGCGGERDQTKRPQMGRIASQNADFSIITNDNPRSEDPQTIVNEIKSGFHGSQYVVVFDRERAIRVGMQILRRNEVLLIAGKGHENYQEIRSKRIPFSDIATVHRLIGEIEFED